MINTDVVAYCGPAAKQRWYVVEESGGVVRCGEKHTRPLQRPPSANRPACLGHNVYYNCLKTILCSQMILCQQQTDTTWMISTHCHCACVWWRHILSTLWYRQAPATILYSRLWRFASLQNGTSQRPSFRNGSWNHKLRPSISNIYRTSNAIYNKSISRPSTVSLCAEIIQSYMLSLKNYDNLDLRDETCVLGSKVGTTLWQHCSLVGLQRWAPTLWQHSHHILATLARRWSLAKRQRSHNVATTL